MIKHLILGSIRAYQIFISPILGRHCRFYPSCSEYALLAVKKYGGAVGLRKGVQRLLKCYPGNPGGVDLP